MSEDLKKKIDELTLNSRVLNTQINSHKEVINQLMQENLNARTNFSLSQQYLQESIQNVQKLNSEVEALKKENDELKLKLNPPAESPAVADAA